MALVAIVDSQTIFLTIQSMTTHHFAPVGPAPGPRAAFKIKRAPKGAPIGPSNLNLTEVRQADTHFGALKLAMKLKQLHIR